MPPDRQRRGQISRELCTRFLHLLCDLTQGSVKSSPDFVSGLAVRMLMSLAAPPPGGRCGSQKWPTRVVSVAAAVASEPTTRGAATVEPSRSRCKYFPAARCERQDGSRPPQADPRPSTKGHSSAPSSGATPHTTPDRTGRKVSAGTKTGHPGDSSNSQVTVLTVRSGYFSRDT